MLENIDLSKESLRKFGRVMFLCLTSIGLILFIKHKPAFKILWFLGILFLAAAQIYPLSLKYIYRFWMHLGIAIGWINSRIILFIIYYLVITPIGLLAKLFGKDFLSLKIEENKRSYWVKGKILKESKEDYERIF